jgi:hypothetical protein
LETAVGRGRSARQQQLRELSRFLEQVREEEKQRVARELHDELGGTLTAAKIDLQLIGDRLQSDAAISTRIHRVNAALDDAIAVKRRIIEDLRPTLLDNLGIGAALRWQCDQFTKRTGCVCKTVLAERELQLPPELSIAVYRIVQEALTNVAKYAKAKSVEVDLRREGGRWHLRVHDDGVGLDLAKQHHPTSHGLISIRERVRALGGELRIGGGRAWATIEAWLPGGTAGGRRAPRRRLINGHCARVAPATGSVPQPIAAEYVAHIGQPSLRRSARCAFPFRKAHENLDPAPLFCQTATASNQTSSYTERSQLVKLQEPTRRRGGRCDSGGYWCEGLAPTPYWRGVCLRRTQLWRRHPWPTSPGIRTPIGSGYWAGPSCSWSLRLF